MYIWWQCVYLLFEYAGAYALTNSGAYALTNSSAYALTNSSAYALTNSSAYALAQLVECSNKYSSVKSTLV
jgi:hypothetical protein